MNLIRKTIIFAAVICLFSLTGCHKDDWYWNELNSYTEKLATPEPVFDEEASGPTELTLVWAGSKYAYTFVVRYWKEGEEDNVIETLAITYTYTLTDLEPETTYYAQVKARVFDNNEEYNSDFSSVVSATTTSLEEEDDGE